jgi:hypothetical protein
MSIITGTVPQNSTLQPPPAATTVSPLAAFNPTPKFGGEIKQFSFLGSKYSPYKDSSGQSKLSVKLFCAMAGDYESDYSKIRGRVPAELSTTEEVFNKLVAYGVDPRDYEIPLLLEVRLIATSSGTRLNVLDVHLSPYQISQLDKGIQPLSIESPVKN